MKTNSRVVQNKIKEHILDTMSVEDLKANVEGLIGSRGCLTTYHTIKYMVQGGSFLCYYHHVKEFLDSLDINPHNKEFSDEQSWDLYKHLIAQVGSKMLDKLNKNKEV